ncbi:hypothetical protein LTR53_017125, partial [Teratosphaeriaceae sp. CCFEE 6253]
MSGELRPSQTESEEARAIAAMLREVLQHEPARLTTAELLEDDMLRPTVWSSNEARPLNLQRPGPTSLVDSKNTATLGHSRPELARQGFHSSPTAFHLMSFHLTLTHAHHGDPGLSGGHYVAVAESFPSSHLPLNSRPPPMSLAQSLPPLILGGAGFSYQCHPDPEALPIRDVILQAFDAGMRAIDTSPYYEPSEQLLGKALSSPDITDR